MVALALSELVLVLLVWMVPLLVAYYIVKAAVKAALKEAFVDLLPRIKEELLKGQSS